jgi:hypothetical protein
VGTWVGMMRPPLIRADGSGGGGIVEDEVVTGDTAVAIDRMHIRRLDYAKVSGY